MDVRSVVSVGTVVFASTNVDDLVLLSAFFAQPGRRVYAIVIGQFVGIGALVLVSIIAALATVAIPPAAVALIGIVPLALGLRQLMHHTDVESAEEQNGTSLMAVAGVTMANGGDNLGVYIPLFASQTAAIPIYAVVFAVGTAVWCSLGYAFVSHRAVMSMFQRLGHRILPWVLIAIGLHVLTGAAPLFGL